MADDALASANGTLFDLPAGARRPGLVVFDLDDTVWFPEMYMLAGPPFSKDKNSGAVRDAAGEEVRVYPAVRAALLLMHDDPAWAGTRVAVASRTHQKSWAEKCMKLLEMRPGLTLQDCVQYNEIFPACKKQHFANLRSMSGVPYDDMVFLDNEFGNIRDVGQLGVTAIYTPGGMSAKHWEEALKQYATLHAAS